MTSCADICTYVRITRNEQGGIGCWEEEEKQAWLKSLLAGRVLSCAWKPAALDMPERTHTAASGTLGWEDFTCTNKELYIIFPGQLQKKIYRNISL